MKHKMIVFGIVSMLLLTGFVSLNVTAEDPEETPEYIEITNEELQQLYEAIDNIDDPDISLILEKAIESSVGEKNNELVIDVEILENEMKNAGFGNAYFFCKVKVSAEVDNGNIFSYWPLLYTSITDGSIDVGNGRYTSDSGSVICLFWAGKDDNNPVDIDVFSSIVMIEDDNPDDDSVSKQKSFCIPLLERLFNHHPLLLFQKLLKLLIN